MVGIGGPWRVDALLRERGFFASVDSRRVKDLEV
jgi:hypothetical protein